MLSPGKALKVTVYLQDGKTHHGVSTYSAMLDFLFSSRVSGAAVFKGVAGFGVEHHLHAANILQISDHLPLKIEFIETADRVDGLIGKLREIDSNCLIVTQETTVVQAPQLPKG